MHDDPAKIFGYRFVILARRWRQRLDRELAKSGLTDASWAPLFHLSQGGDAITQAELADRVGLDRSSLVRLIDILEARGFVERRVDPEDRRARHILLTEAGSEEVAKIRARLQDLEEGLLAGIDRGQIQMALHLFDEIGQRLAAPDRDE